MGLGSRFRVHLTIPVENKVEKWWHPLVSQLLKANDVS